MAIDEPASLEETRAWIQTRMVALDRFAHIAQSSRSHREEHGCDTYPTGQGRLLGVLAAALAPSRILEVGCGLGYSALWLAWGAGANGAVETIERDPSHAELADLDKAALYRESVLDETQWVTAFVGEKTLSVVRAAG